MIKEIEIKNNDSKILKLRDSFKKHWNMTEINEDRKKLKIRCLAIISRELNNVIIEDLFGNIDVSDYINNWCYHISIVMGVEHQNDFYDKFENKSLYKYINDLSLEDENDYKMFMYFLQLTLNCNYGEYINKKNLVRDIAEALVLSNANVKIVNNNGLYELYPIDIPLLDEKLVFDVLSWLDDYSETKKHFDKALKMEKKENNYRNIIDELRLSLEFFFKQIFNNEKSLENQKNNLGRYMNQKNISAEISNMYIKLIDLYTDYNNHTAKHEDKVEYVEINFMIYLTGNFIRFILLLEQVDRML